MSRYVIQVEVEAEDEEKAAEEFLMVIEHYLGGIYTERPFSIAMVTSLSRT